MIKQSFNILNALGNAKKLSFKEVWPHHYIYTYFYDGVELWAFFSFEKLICVYAPTQSQLAIDNNNWDCSKTTCKYFAKFINIYTHLDYISKHNFEGLIYQGEKNGIYLFSTDRWHK